MSKFCVNCGHELDDGAVFCTRCGKEQGSNAKFSYEESEPSNVLFNNIGRKIKFLASITAWVGIVIFAIIGIVFFASYQVVAGIMILLFGTLICWISGFTLYAFGQLVDNSDKIVKLLKDKNKE